MPEENDKQALPTPLEEIESLIRALPDSPAVLKKERERAVTALAGFDSADNPLAGAMDACISTLRDRTTELMGDITSPPHVTESLPQLEFHQKQTIAIPASEIPRKVVPEEVSEEEPSKEVHWNDAERRLYKDVLCLFDLGDQPGAMTSMERLVMLSPDAEELRVFLDKNGESLVTLYQEHFGSLDRVPIPIKEQEPVKIPTDSAHIVMDVLQLVDGHRTIKDILKRSKIGELHALASIAHLARSGFVELA